MEYEKVRNFAYGVTQCVYSSETEASGDAYDG